MSRLTAIVALLALPAIAAAQTPSHRATRMRGEAVGMGRRSPSATIDAVRITPAQPAHGIGPAIPASPSRKPTNPGQSGNHRP
jgi:hypothetical protein